MLLFAVGLEDLISIHALHEESDGLSEDAGGYEFQISIHALHEESDTVEVTALTASPTFQSTLSMRRATRCGVQKSKQRADFNPRSP